MDSKTYNAITRFCSNFLKRDLHGRHLEDIIQFVAMKHFESKGLKSWSWSCCDYCRENGLNYNSYSKAGAKALEQSLSIDAPIISKNEENENSEYLLDQESILRSKHEVEKTYQNDSYKGVLEEFLSPLNLNKEVTKWIMENYNLQTLRL